MNLPKNLLKSLTVHLHHSERRQKQFLARHDRQAAEKFKFSDKEKTGVLAGEVFEELVRTEFKMNEFARVQNDPEKKDAFITQLRLARELMRVWQYPEKFGIDVNWRNPDAAFFEINDEGKVVIKSVGEVKAGSLDARAYEQLKSTGIQNQLKEVLHVLKNKDATWFKQKKLPELEAVCQNLSIADDFKIQLFVPRNREVSASGITYEEAERLTKQNYRDRTMVAGKSTQPVTIHAMAYELSESKRISVQKSLFSQRELGVLTEFLFKKIQAE